MHESEVAQLCQPLPKPMDCSLPGSSIHGIFQARVLEWGAIAFSAIYLQISVLDWHLIINGSELLKTSLARDLGRKDFHIAKKKKKDVFQNILLFIPLYIHEIIC